MKDHERVRLVSRTGRDHAARFPELVARLTEPPARTVMLDGEMCRVDEQLVSRLHLLSDADPDEISTPPVFMAFDCLHLGCRDLRGLPLRDRRKALEDVIAGQTLVYPARLAGWRRALNTVVRVLLRFGLGPRHTYLLAVRGRRSGRLYSTPVTLVETGEKRWLVPPYGEVAWVHNARAAGQVTLSRGRRSESVRIRAVDAPEAGPVLKQYATEVPITRPFFDARPDAQPRRSRAKRIAIRCSASSVERRHRRPELALAGVAVHRRGHH